MQRMEAVRDERRKLVAARRGSSAAGGGEVVPMDAQALCREIISAEMHSSGGDPREGLSEDAYTELMIAMEQTLLHEMRSDVASLGAGADFGLA